MHTKSWTMLRVLMNRYHADNTESVLKGLPSDQAQQILSQSTKASSVEVPFAHSSDLIEQIHFSWFTPILKQLPPKLQEIFVAALPPSMINRVAHAMDLAILDISLSKPVKSYLMNVLYSKLNHHDVLPLEYLPSTSLTQLAQLKKEELERLVDYLGLYDLAEEIRHIVDKKKLQRIYESLSKKRQTYLKTCLHQKLIVHSPKLNLDAWDGQDWKLHKILHRRGMIRLGYALSGQDPDLIWHITHSFDTGRAKLLAKHCSDKEIPKVTPVLVQQIQDLIKFLNPRSLQ